MNTKAIIYNLKYRFGSKQDKELEFWRLTINQYIDWYKGKINLYGENPPSSRQKIKAKNIKESAILTWSKVHQEKKYLNDLKLKQNSFKGKKVLDIGSGPHPSGLCFKGVDLYCLDPLLTKYISVGFPIEYYPQVKFIQAPSENIPFPDNYFDAVISVNAIDHVDDIYKTSQEIKRVLKHKGKMRMHIHYHEKNSLEPIHFNDQIVKEIFSWCKGFKKIDESLDKTGSQVKFKGEKYTIWSN